MKKIKILFALLLLFLCIKKESRASQLDFSWNAPKTYVHNEGTGGEVLFILWFYNLKNVAEKPILIPIEIFLETDTKEGYRDMFYPEIMERAAALDADYTKGKKYQHAATVYGELLPQATKNCVAMFEDVDPQAKRLEIFVTGISSFSFWQQKMNNYSYKITYRKEQDHWKLIKHEMSKDSPHHSSGFELGNW
ncbi:MAG: hypothetical protein MRJ65_08745 [Candidatus Brocadiaceae bacterium]|nr:hypothetical protein [Candidatus Brocadiaceae bacterium]